MEKINLIILAFSSLILSACATGHCDKYNKDLSVHLKAEKQQHKDQLDLTASKKTIKKAEEDKIWIYKYDGSQQCKMGKLVSPKKMLDELKNVKVHEYKRQYDGLMHLQVCGGITGYANVYLINKDQLNKAEKRGFKVWRFN